MRLKNTICLLLVCLCLTGEACAETAIEAKIDKTSITTDDTITYKVIIASTRRRLPAPQLPPFEGFRILSRAQSSTALYRKSALKNVFIFVFILAPTETGKFVIAPSRITIDGQTLTTQGFDVEVTAGKAGPKNQPLDKPARPGGNQTESKKVQVTL